MHIVLNALLQLALTMLSETSMKKKELNILFVEIYAEMLNKF